MNRKDASGTADECVEDFNQDNNTFNDVGNPTGGGGGGVSGENMGNSNSVGNGAHRPSNPEPIREGTDTNKPASPAKVSDSYIKNNKIDAHGFKKAAGAPPNKLSRYNIYKDKGNGGRLWIGSTSEMDWMSTPYYFWELTEVWKK